MSLVIVFFSQEFLQAQGGESLWSHVTDAKNASNPKSLNEKNLPGSNLAVPAGSGLIRRVSSHKDSDLIINIQDAHSKLGAQESITKILDTLVRNYDLNLVAMEAAAGSVDTALISSFPIEEARKKAAQYFLAEGKISAGEFYSMIAKEPVKLFGAEDADLYSENLEAFKTVIEKKPAIRRELTALSSAVSELGKAVYSQELLEMQNKKLLHKTGDIHFTEYWEYFNKLALEHGISMEQFPNLKKLSETVELEKEIDFKKATVEREALIDELRGKLPTQDLQKLVLLMLQFKQNKITPGAFHYELSRLAQGHNIDPLKNKNVIIYSQYVVVYESIDLIEIFDEVERFETELKEKMFQNEDEKALSRLERCAVILAKLLDTSLSSKDYEFYIKNESSCEIASLKEALTLLGDKYKVDATSSVDFKALESSLPSAKTFYDLASRRNKALLNNTLKRMKKENVKVAALITGGFHSEGISELMDQDKLSYLVIMPKFDEKSPDRPYLTVITKKPKEFEAQFKDSEFYIAAATFADIDGIARTTYGVDEQQEFLRLSFAALMVSARIAAGFDGSAPEVREVFLQNYKARGGTLIAEETLNDWLKSLIVRRSAQAYEVIFSGNSFFVSVENGVIRSVEKRTAAGAVVTELPGIQDNLSKMSEQLKRIQSSSPVEITLEQELEFAEAVGSRLSASDDAKTAVENYMRRKNFNFTLDARERITAKAIEIQGARLAAIKAPERSVKEPVKEKEAPAPALSRELEPVETAPAVETIDQGSRLANWKKIITTLFLVFASLMTFATQVFSQTPAERTKPLVRFVETNLDAKGLPLSMRIPKGYWDSPEYRSLPSNVVEELLLQHMINTYDLAARNIVLAKTGNWKEVTRINNLLGSGTWGELGTTRAFRTNTGSFMYGDKGTELDAGTAFYFRSLASSYLQENHRYPASDPRHTTVKGFAGGGDRLRHVDWIPTMGENAWLILEGAQTARLAHPSGPVPLHARQLKIAFGLLEAMEAMQNAETGAVYHAPGNTFGKLHNEVSVENDQSLYAALSMLLTIVEENQGAEAEAYAKRIRGILYGSEGKRGLEDFLLSDAFDVKNGIFYQGGLVEKKHFVPTKTENVFAADVQTWGILSLGPARIDAKFGKGTALKIWKETRRIAGYFDAKDPNKILGIGFTRGNDKLSSEWSAGAVFAVWRLADHYSKDPQFESEVEQLLKDATSMREGIESLRVVLEDGSAAYLYANKRFPIEFGFWNGKHIVSWNANPIPSLAGTTWVIFIETGFDPMVLGGGDYKARIEALVKELAAKKELRDKPVPVMETVKIEPESNMTVILIGTGILLAGGMVFLILVHDAKKRKKEEEAKKEVLMDNMYLGYARNFIKEGKAAESNSFLEKALGFYEKAITNFELMSENGKQPLQKEIDVLKQKRDNIQKTLEKDKSGARLAVGFVGRADDAVFQAKIEALIARSAVADVTYQIFESPSAAAQFKDDAGRTISLIVDESTIDQVDSQIEVIRTIRKLNDARLEQIYGALTKLVVLTATQKFYGTSDAEFREALGRIIEVVKLPEAEAIQFELLYSQGRGVIWNAKMANEFAKSLDSAVQGDEASLGVLKEFLGTVGNALQNEDSARSMANEMASEPKFWQAAFGVNQEGLLAMSTSVKGGVMFTLKQYLKDKQRFKDALDQGLYATVVMTNAESTTLEGMEVISELEARQRLIVSDRKLSTIQAAYVDLAEVQGISASFVLAASEDELGENGVLVDDEAVLTGESKALVLTVEAQAVSTSGLVEAARILLSDWKNKGILPRFIEIKGDGLFKFLPKAAPIELAAWMASVKKQLLSVGAAA